MRKPPTLEEKLDTLRQLGIDPKRLQEYNPLFFNRIIYMMKEKGVGGSGDPLPTPWLENKELAKYYEDMERKNKMIHEPKVDTPEISTKDEIKIKEKPGAKWNTKGKFRKK